MKRYKKKPTKLLQIRLSEKEYDQVKEFINRFEVTHREWILTVVNELRDMNIIREGEFFPRHQEFAWQNSDRWDKQITYYSKCSNCKKTSEDLEEEGLYSKLERHHYAGYEGENAFKTIILCRRCHSQANKKVGKNKK